MKLNPLIVLAFALFLAACSGTLPETTSSDPVTLSPLAHSTPDQELQKQIAEIAKEADGKVGVYATVIETGESVSLNEYERFAMQSVVKLPIALTILMGVEDGKLDLDQNIKFSKVELVPSNMRSPLRDSNPEGGKATIRELLRLAVSDSDGTAADILQRVAGDADGVQAFIDSLGITDMKVKYSHKEFGEKWERQYENWVTPKAAVELLKRFYAGNGASEENRELLLKFMTESKNPPGRIVAGLPKGTVVAHKTGTGGTRDGITSATNDVGIITLPNGNHIAIAVFVGDSKADIATRERVIAKITKAIWDNWSTEKPSEPVKTANFTERHTLN